MYATHAHRRRVVKRWLEVRSTEMSTLYEFAGSYGVHYETLKRWVSVYAGPQFVACDRELWAYRPKRRFCEPGKAQH